MTKFNNEETIVSMAHFILDNQTTIRATAKQFATPKSTVHHNLSTKLRYINFPLYLKVKELLINNFNIKHIHGGLSTKNKYEKLKLEINKIDEFDSISI